MFRDLFCCEVFIVSISVLDFVEVFTREGFLQFSFTALPIKLLTDDGANWVHLFDLESGCGACIPAFDGSFFGLICDCTLGSLLTV